MILIHGDQQLPSCTDSILQGWERKNLNPLLLFRLMCMEDKKKSPYFIAKNPCFKLSCEMFYLKFELCFLLAMLKDTVSFICTSVTFSAFLTIQIVNLMKPKGIAAAWKLIFRIQAHSAVTGNIHLSVQLGNWYFLLASIYCIPNDEKPEFLPPAFYFF